MVSLVRKWILEKIFTTSQSETKHCLSYTAKFIQLQLDIFFSFFFLILLKNELDYAKIIGLILYHELKIRCCKKEDLRNWRRTENVFGTLFRKPYRSIRVCAVYNKIPYWIMLTLIFTKYYLSLHYKWWLPNFK